ncbi:S8 family serine peptidase [bacterium]|nr:S8 family serine peptidase [bacterium]
MSHHRGSTCSRLALSIVALVLAAGAWPQSKAVQDLAGPLRSLAAGATVGSVSTSAVSRLGLITRGNEVGVDIMFRSEAAAAATGLSRFGITPHSRHGRCVEAMVPVDQLAAIASLAQVAQVRPTQRVFPMQGYGAADSEGVQLTNATAFHLAGIYGNGAKVAIIDTGFNSLSTTEVPVDTTTDLVDLRLGTTGAALGSGSHGAAVAEIVADMAEECDMTLILVDTVESVVDAAQYVAAQGFDVANMSLGIATGPFDGTHEVSQAVNDANAAGVLWVNSAGNWAQRHWQGSWTDTNSDTYLEFSGTKDTMSFALNAGVFDVYLSWYENAGTQTSNDYDLVLLDSSGAIIARSAVTQNGDDVPEEELVAYIGTAGTYRLKLQRMSTLAGSTPDRFQLYTPEYDIETSLQHSEDSLAIPAEASGAYAVGATRGSNLVVTGYTGIAIDELEPYSSRGSLGSSDKPNIVGPDAVTTSLAGYVPFTGTSAAAPHVAGAAALLISEDDSRSATTVRMLLKQMARTYSVPGDIPATDVNGYGLGRVSLRVGASSDGEAPVVTIEYPVNNSTITMASPSVVATVEDANGVDPDTIQVWLDGTQIVTDGVPGDTTLVTNYTFDSSTGDLTFGLSGLTRTLHRLQIQGSDLAGNASEIAVSNFRITTQTVSTGLHIIALPYPDLTIDDWPSTVFGVTVEQVALVRWVPSDSRTSKYHIWPDEYASFEPPDELVSDPPAGLGYFLSLASTGTLSASGKGVTADSYNISLVYGTGAPRGWNLIGNPYGSYVDWGSVEFLSDSGRQDLSEAIDPDGDPVTDGVLFDYVSTTGGGYYSFDSDPTQSTMDPLTGYWVHVLKDATLIVYNTGSTTASTKTKRQSSAKTSAQSSAPSASRWTLQLKAVAGKYEDPANYLGVAAAATAGYDVGLDVAEPPALVDTLRLYMPASEGNLAKDVRSAVSTRQTWDVSVSCRLADTPVTVSWPSLNSSVPRDVSLRLVDQDSGSSVYMRTTTGYTFTMAEAGVRHLQVVADAAASNALVVSGVSAAAMTSGQTVFAYTVSREANVAVEIRNISGVLIRNLGERTAAPGTTQTLLWNGQSERGTRVPAGRYLARITARATDGQSVQTIRPFSVSR